MSEMDALFQIRNRINRLLYLQGAAIVLSRPVTGWLGGQQGLDNLAYILRLFAVAFGNFIQGFGRVFHLNSFLLQFLNDVIDLFVGHAGDLMQV